MQWTYDILGTTADLQSAKRAGKNHDHQCKLGAPDREAEEELCTRELEATEYSSVIPI